MIAYIEEPILAKKIDEEILNALSIWHNETEILPQKIRLHELDMNWLFSEVFMGEADIEYAWYGGKGCDFAITIKGKQKEE